MDSNELLKLRNEEKTEALQLEKENEIKKTSIDEGKERQLEVKKNELSKINSAADEISPEARGKIKELNKNKAVPVQMAKVNLPDIHSEIALASIQKMNLKTKSGMLEQIINCPELHNNNELKGLLDQYLFILSISGDEKKIQEKNRFGLDAANCRKVLKAKIGDCLGDPRSYQIPAESKNVFININHLVNDCFGEDQAWLPELIQEEPEALAKWNKLVGENEEFVNQIDKNAIFDEEDKIVRKIELYRTHEESLKSFANGLNAEKAEMARIRFAYQINRMEKQLADFRGKRKILRDSIDAMNARLESMKKTDTHYEPTSKALEALQQAYREQYTTSFKQDLFAIDNKEEMEKNRNADDTLDKAQIQAVRRLDKWMLEHATDEYKDKSFIVQVMGLTVRERLAMYLCVEMDNYKPDYAELLFSQANYLPDEERIKQVMYGHGPLRKWGWKRIHWSKMRRAYEHITNKSGDINTLADMAVKEQAKHKEVRENYREVPEGQIGSILKNESTYKVTLKDNANIKGIELHRSVVKAGKDIVTTIQKIRNSEGNDEQLVADLRMQTMVLRSLVDKEIEKTEDKGFSKHWSRYKAAVKEIDSYNTHYGTASKIATALRKMDVFDEDSKVGITVDGTEFVAKYATSTVKLLKCVNSTVNMYRDWKNASRSYDLRAITTTTDSLSSFLLSANETYTMTKKYGLWANGFKESRKAAAKKVEERVTEGLAANEFDFSAANTYYQLISSGMTIGTSVIDYYNIGRSAKASKEIRLQIQNRQKNKGVDAKYRKETYQKAIVNLNSRLNLRKGITATTNIVSNAAGYLKYILPTTFVGEISGGITVGITYLTKGLDKYLKKRSDYKTVDDFLDLDQLLQEYGRTHHDVDINDNAFRKQFRKNAMMQLGFANTKTFFVHVSTRLASMIYSMLNKASRAGGEEMENAKPLATIVKAMGLGVDLARKIIPTAKMIAAKLSA